MAISLGGPILCIIHAKPGRMFRPLKDLKDCTTFVTDGDFPLEKIDNLVVVFAEKDTVMDYGLTGGHDPENPGREEVDAFPANFFQSLSGRGAKQQLLFLEGNHLAPVSFHDDYATVVLEGLDASK